MLKKVLLAVSALGILTLALLIYSIFDFASSPVGPIGVSSGSAETEKKIIEIKRSLGPKAVTKLLVDQQILSPEHSERFYWYGRITRKFSNLKAGEYELSRSQTPKQIFDVLSSGVSVFYPLTVREGANLFEVAEEFKAKNLATPEALMALVTQPEFTQKMLLQNWIEAPAAQTLEGYLFPETYHFNRTMSLEEMISAMVKGFRLHWTEKEAARARELGLTPHEVVTLASIIEKETGASQERPLISSVFHNRLKKQMRLQSDPTTIYGIWKKYNDQGKNLKREDLLTSTPYNTYTVNALPKGPIGNPGKEAIEAALHPTDSAFLYFVSHNDGTHQFSRTLEEHNHAVKRFQMDPKARAGKSWRDLKKAGN